VTEPSLETVQRIWMITLAVYGLVVVVVAVLLTLILRAARDVRAGVSAIWTVGQRVANNTIHVALLDTTNHVAGAILTSASSVASATAALRDHARGCPGCPDCVVGGSASR
jgi:K+ transporter